MFSYVGSAVGDTFDSPNNAIVGAFDFAGVRDHQRDMTEPLAMIDNIYDLDRDRDITAADMMIARDAGQAVYGIVAVDHDPTNTGRS